LPSVFAAFQALAHGPGQALHVAELPEDRAEAQACFRRHALGRDFDLGILERCKDGVENPLPAALGATAPAVRLLDGVHRRLFESCSALRHDGPRARV
jgi:hypothetical protein